MLEQKSSQRRTLEVPRSVDPPNKEVCQKCMIPFLLVAGGENGRGLLGPS